MVPYVLWETNSTYTLCFVFISLMRCVRQTVDPCLSLILSLSSECPWPLSLYDHKSAKHQNKLRDEDRETKTPPYASHNIHAVCLSFFLCHHYITRCQQMPHRTARTLSHWVEDVYVTLKLCFVYLTANVNRSIKTPPFYITVIDHVTLLI